MGIPGLNNEMRSIEGCVIDVSIKELVEKCGENVIVVDGFNFYGVYLYPKFNWVCGAFRELVQEIRHFVESFQRIGVKLVFFFVEGNLDEGLDCYGTASWKKRRSEFIQYTRMLFAKSSQWNLQNINVGRAYYHTPLNALPVVLFALQYIFNCEVHLVYQGFRTDSVANYSRSSNCLALLGEDNIYVFYHDVPRYLSIKQLNLRNMTTVQYCPDVLAQHRNLEGHLYPLFIRGGSPTSDQKNILFKIGTKLNECESTDVARKIIHDYLSGKNKEVLAVEDLNIENIPKHYIANFLCDILQYKLVFEGDVVFGPLKEWDLIKLQAQKLYESGQMSRYIEQILKGVFVNDCILEDFTELPPSSELYSDLRNKLYSVLLAEKPQKDKIVPESDASDRINDSETSDRLDVTEPSDRFDGIETPDGRKWVPAPVSAPRNMLVHSFGEKDPRKFKCILDWRMRQEGCPDNFVLVFVEPILHPGLLHLWCRDNMSTNISEKKWQLFASCISDNLQWQLLCLLPPKLVVPTVVLYYLYNVVPPKFKTNSWKFLQMWEMEVFIAQAVMLPKIDDNTLSRINIKKLNPRVVNLIAFFIYGCHHVRLLIEACGYPISEYDLCVFHCFDGKLFHSFYDRAEWRRNAKNLCDRETSDLFEKMKQIINPDPPSRY